MKKTAIYIFGILLVLAAVYFFIVNSEQSNYEKEGNILIEKVEIFKEKNGYLPNTHKDIEEALEMGEGPYYEKLNDTVFIVYFNIGFDDRIVYNSSKKKWEDNR